MLPGLGNSGPEHWQSRWERRHPDCRRVLQDEWDAPAIRPDSLPCRAREYASDWGAELVVLEGAGHINVASGHGVWEAGFELLMRL